VPVLVFQTEHFRGIANVQTRTSEEIANLAMINSELIIGLLQVHRVHRRQHQPQQTRQHLQQLHQLQQLQQLQQKHHYAIQKHAKIKAFVLKLAMKMVLHALVRLFFQEKDARSVYVSQIHAFLSLRFYPHNKHNLVS
jgi:hypothetical protein